MNASTIGRALMAAAVVVVLAWTGQVYRQLSAAERASASLDAIRAGHVRPDYDEHSLRWVAVDARTFALDANRITLVTGDRPYLYQATAEVPTSNASFVHLLVRGRLAAGGLSVGILAGGRWITSRSISGAGAFDELLTARLTGLRQITVVVANNNPNGESAAEIAALQLFLVR